MWEFRFFEPVEIYTWLNLLIQIVAGAIAVTIVMAIILVDFYNVGKIRRTHRRVALCLEIATVIFSLLIRSFPLLLLSLITFLLMVLSHISNNIIRNRAPKVKSKSETRP